MILEFRRADLFASADLNALAHGCNCAGAMGKGIAVEFRRRWPAMFAEYQARCRTGEFGLGDMFPWEADEMMIYNLGTQSSWRAKADLSAIRASVRSMVEHAEAHDVRAIGMPKIGAGLGRLPWAEVQDCLNEIVASSPVRIVVHELEEPQDID